MKNSGKTDWKRVNNLTDNTIDYSDIPDTSSSVQRKKNIVEN
jgi:hypothetical protein